MKHWQKLLFLLVFAVPFVTVGVADASLFGVGSEQPNDGGKLIVSSVGTYYSPTSVSILYVPESTDSARVRLIEVENEINGADGRIKWFSVRPMYDNNSCGDYTTAFASASSDPVTGVANNTELTFDNTTSTTSDVTAGSTTYKRYCVFVTTDNSMSSSCATAPGCFSMNVTFRLETFGSRLLANYSGPSSAQGTGYYREVPTSNSRWGKVVDFAVECDVDPVSARVHMYDLDTYQGDSAGGDNEDQFYRLFEADKGQNNWVSVPTLSSWADTNDLGDNRYHPFDVPTGGTVSIRPSGNFNLDKKYRLEIQEISRRNKIRLNIPSGQLFADIDCPSPIPPTNWEYEHNSFSASFSSATAPYNVVLPGTAISVSNEIINSDTGEGRNYNQRLQYRINGGAWTNISGGVFDGLDELGAGATNSESATYNIPDTTANNTIICFRGAITPFSGQSTPTKTTTSTGWRVTTARCVTVFNDEPEVTTLEVTCSLYRYETQDSDAVDTDGDGTLDSLRVDLIVDGAVAATLNNQAPGQGSFDLSPWLDLYAHEFSVRITDTSPGGKNDTTEVNTVGPCISATCGSLSQVSVGVSAGQFNASFSFNLSGSIGSNISPHAYSADLDFAGTSYTMVTDAGATVGSLDSTSGAGPFSMNANNISPPDTPGVYTARVSVSGIGVDTLDCTFTINVYLQPYARFYGNDTISCNSVRGTFNPDVSQNHDNYVGSASELAIFASNIIEGFAPGSMDSGRSGLQELAFGNLDGSVDLANASYGGSFASCNRATDFSVPSDLIMSNNADVGRFNAGNHEYLFTGNTELTGTLGLGERVAVYVDGDVEVGSITYSNNTWDDDDPTVTDPSVKSDPSLNISNLTVVATGNIFIGHDVDRIDGTLISLGGDIFTCSGDSSGTLDLLDGSGADNAFIVNSCGEKLTVNGSLFANRIHFLRINGTLANGIPYESYDLGNIAESVRFSPEIYLINGGGLRARPSANPTIDSIVARPPAF